MEKQFIENALKVMKFNIEETEKDLLQFVNMREYGVANKQKPLLLTIGLQSCIALIAYEKNFSFLAHMNIYKGNCEKDFESAMPPLCDCRCFYCHTGPGAGGYAAPLYELLCLFLRCLPAGEPDCRDISGEQPQQSGL